MASHSNQWKLILTKVYMHNPYRREPNTNLGVESEDERYNPICRKSGKYNPEGWRTVLKVRHSSFSFIALPGYGSMFRKTSRGTKPDTVTAPAVIAPVVFP